MVRQRRLVGLILLGVVLILLLHIKLLLWDVPHSLAVVVVEPPTLLLLGNTIDLPSSTLSSTSSLGKFPSFHHGGVILFYHLPRTGGTTIREYFRQQQRYASSSSSSSSLNSTTLEAQVRHNIQYLRVSIPRDWVTAEARIEAVLTRRQLQQSAQSPPQQDQREEIVFVELHGRIPGLPYWHDRIQQWRQLSLQHNVPLFTFTVVREPIAFSLSYFVHFHGKDCIWNWCERILYNDKYTWEENLLNSVVSNHQCQVLLLGQMENKKHAPPRRNVTEEECRRDVLYYLRTDWDWVGSTDELDTTTLPLLHQLLQPPPPQHIKQGTNGVNSDNKMHMIWNNHTHTKYKTLDHQTRTSILKRSQFDHDLYKMVHGGKGRLMKV